MIQIILITIILFFFISTVIQWIKFVEKNKKLDRINNFFLDINNVVNSIRYGNLSARVEQSDNIEMKNVSESINRMIETLNDREQMIIEYQSELTSQNKFLSALLNTLSDGILVLDEKFIILDSNSKIKKWLGNDDLVGEDVKKFIKIPDDKDITELSNDEIFLKTQKDLYFKGTIKQIDSKEHDDKYMLVITNYTNQKEIDSLKEDFVATLTHDLKVPIVAESNMFEFLLEEKFGSLTDKQKEALTNMKNSNGELLELVKTVLDTYKMKEGEIELNIENFSIEKFLKEIITEIDSIAQKTNNKLIINIDKDFNISADYLQLKRVLKNLINNAISYGKSNTDIDITVEKFDKYFTIKVKDYGKGISKEDIDKIFNRYYSASKKFRKIGTGLGLYLSKQIVQTHNGTLKVQSKEGEYTEFCIQIPLI